MNPAHFPIMNALTNSMMLASTSTHPKNSIETTVDVTDRTTATMPGNINAIPNARNHHQC